jgi:hypothetical protein
MSTDRHTKAVLTVIAAALVSLVAQNTIRPARAVLGDNVQKVAICDQFGTTCADTTFVSFSDTSIPGVPPLKINGLQVVVKSP